MSNMIAKKREDCRNKIINTKHYSLHNVLMYIVHSEMHEISDF